jgi:hypothetical protein
LSEDTEWGKEGRIWREKEGDVRQKGKEKKEIT